MTINWRWEKDVLFPQSFPVFFGVIFGESFGATCFKENFGKKGSRVPDWSRFAAEQKKILNLFLAAEITESPGVYDS